MNLSVKKLRRGITVIGGTFLGLGVAAAMATPALACHPAITAVSSCVNTDGSWQVTWAVTGSDRGIGGDITAVEISPADSTLTGIVVGADIPGAGRGHHALTGTQQLQDKDGLASISVTAHFVLNGQDIVAKKDSEWVKKPSRVCRTHPSTPPTTPATTPPTTPATTPPTTAPTSTPPSTPVTEPQFVYDTTCTTFTVGVEVPKTWEKDVTVTFTPSTGTAKTVTAKPGETKTVDFPASKGLTVKASPKDYPDESATIDYKAPADCTSAAPSSSAPVLAVTGSSSAPLAGGAIALVLVGGGAFFLARRRKMKFTA